MVDLNENIESLIKENTHLKRDNAFLCRKIELLERELRLNRETSAQFVEFVKRYCPLKIPSEPQVVGGFNLHNLNQGGRNE